MSSSPRRRINFAKNEFALESTAISFSERVWTAEFGIIITFEIQNANRELRPAMLCAKEIA